MYVCAKIFIVVFGRDISIFYISNYIVFILISNIVAAVFVSREGTNWFKCIDRWDYNDKFDDKFDVKTTTMLITSIICDYLNTCM